MQIPGPCPRPTKVVGEVGKQADKRLEIHISNEPLNPRWFLLFSCTCDLRNQETQFRAPLIWCRVEVEAAETRKRQEWSYPFLEKDSNGHKQVLKEDGWIKEHPEAKAAQWVKRFIYCQHCNSYTMRQGYNQKEKIQMRCKTHLSGNKDTHQVGNLPSRSLPFLVCAHLYYLYIYKMEKFVLTLV